MDRPVVGAAKDRQLVVRLSADLRARLERVRAALSEAGTLTQGDAIVALSISARMR